jgi:hypothetical protein
MTIDKISQRCGKIWQNTAVYYSGLKNYSGLKKIREAKLTE